MSAERSRQVISTNLDQTFLSRVKNHLVGYITHLYYKWLILQLLLHSWNVGGSPYGIVANMLDCGIVVRECKLQLYYYVHFLINTLGKDINTLIPPAMGYVELLLLFYKDSFGIK